MCKTIKKSLNLLSFIRHTLDKNQMCKSVQKSSSVRKLQHNRHIFPFGSDF